MGLANEWVKYDTKWGRQQSYYIPLMSSAAGQVTRRATFRAATAA